MSLKHPIQSPENGILLKWFVTNNQSIQSDQLLAHIRRISPDPGSNEKTDDDLITIKSHHEGNFKRITLEGHKIQINDIIGEIIECTHPAVFRNLCVSCGKKILIPPQSTKQTNSTHGAKLTMAGGQTIQLSKLEAQQRQTTKLASMQKSRKLALILDLDSTLVHATAYIPFPKEILDKVKPIQLEDNGFIVRHLVKLRPHVEHFLESCRSLFQMTIYTHGTRGYAEATARLLDPHGIYFGKRIVSRTDHPDLGLEKCLSRLFLEDWSMAVVLDDRDDVWKKDQQTHVICIRPYLFFNQLFPHGANLGEINNAAGLATTESLLNDSPPNPSSSSGDEKRKAVDDNDIGLLKSLDTLQYLHTKYYELLDAGNPSPNVGNILLTLRQSILKGCHLCFSGIIPANLQNPQNHRLWIIAKNLGAKVSLKLSPQTTHLLTTSLETEKSQECLRLGNVYVCHPDWLLHCHWHLLREDEALFLLAPIQTPPSIDPSHDEVVVEDDANQTEQDPPTLNNDHKRSRPMLNRSNAGEYGVNYNSNTESDDSSSDEENERKRKYRRFYTLSQILNQEENDENSDEESSSDVDESWIQSIEDEIVEGERNEVQEEEEEEEEECS